MGQTPNYALPYPEDTDLVDVAGDIKKLADKVDTLLGTSWAQLGKALVGMIVPYGSQTPPTGWLVCDGRMLSQTAYPALFAVLGHTFDVSAVSGQFGIPDLRGRAVYGVDTTASAQQMPLGSHEGSAPGGRGPWHRHSVDDHAHGMSHGHTVQAHSHGMSHTHQYVGWLNSGAYVVEGGSTRVYYLPSGNNTGPPSYTETSTSAPDTGPPTFPNTSPATNLKTSSSGGAGGSTVREDRGSYLALGYIIAAGV